MNIKGKTIVITGGASGMGAETARFLSEKGGKVAILDQDLTAATQIAKEIDGIALQCDVSLEKAVESALNEIKQRIDLPRVLVNCAGIAPAERIVTKNGPMPLENFKKVIDVNLIGTFNMLRLTAALMSTVQLLKNEEERGVIINTASIAAFEGQIGQSGYSASKAGVCGLTLPAARELARFQIRVMTIAPGLIQTPLLERLSPKVQEELASQIPFPTRLGRAAEFAHLASHIIENSYLNGEVIRLDGALRMQA